MGRLGVEIDDLRPELIEAARLLVTGLGLVTKVFAVNADAEIRELVDDFQRLGGYIANDFSAQ
jgi:hypothetical protein